MFRESREAGNVKSAAKAHPSVRAQAYWLRVSMKLSAWAFSYGVANGSCSCERRVAPVMRCRPGKRTARRSRNGVPTQADELLWNHG